MNKFPKQERLSGLDEIDHLFKTGKTLVVPPLKVIYEVPEHKGAAPVKVLITVPSRRFRKAVDRNRIRRKIRESYRLHKNQLFNRYLQAGSTMLMGIIYIGEDPDPDYALIERSIIQCIERLGKKPIS